MKKILIILSSIIIVSMFVYVYSATIGDLKDDLSDTKYKQKETKNEIEEIKSEKAVVFQELQGIDKDINVTENEVDDLNGQIDKYDGLITNQEKKLGLASTQYLGQDALLKVRIKTLYEKGAINFWDVLFSSKSLSEFLSRYYIISKIIEYDRTMLHSIDTQKKYIEDIKNQLEIQKKERETVLKDKERIATILDGKRKARDLYLTKLESQQDELEKILNELVEQSKQLEKKIKELQNTKKKFVGGKFAWPIPGYTRITSPFGMRMHPVLKKYKLHTGVDIGAPTGAKLVAANSGKVIISSWYGGYGKAVVIDHGGGFATLYGHASQLYVSSGDQVEKGQVIAACGSTGWSTGPHLHFEIRQNGAVTDPMAWYK